jgi:hypothetical protein
MKGLLFKNEQGWVVATVYDFKEGVWTSIYPLHPDFLDMMNTCFTYKFSNEVEYEIVKEVEGNLGGSESISYAKLINRDLS